MNQATGEAKLLDLIFLIQTFDNFPESALSTEVENFLDEFSQLESFMK